MNKQKIKELMENAKQLELLNEAKETLTFGTSARLVIENIGTGQRWVLHKKYYHVLINELQKDSDILSQQLNLE